MKNYFVAYSWSGKDASGFGNIDITLEYPVRSSADVKLIVDAIKNALVKDGFAADSVIILSWKLFEG